MNISTKFTLLFIVYFSIMAKKIKIVWTLNNVFPYIFYKGLVSEYLEKQDSVPIFQKRLKNSEKTSTTECRFGKFTQPLFITFIFLEIAKIFKATSLWSTNEEKLLLFRGSHRRCSMHVVYTPPFMLGRLNILSNFQKRGA